MSMSIKLYRQCIDMRFEQEKCFIIYWDCFQFNLYLQLMWRIEHFEGDRPKGFERYRYYIIFPEYKLQLFSQWNVE